MAAETSSRSGFIDVVLNRLFAALGPEVVHSGTEPQRRRAIAILVAHLAVVTLVIAATGTAIVSGSRHLPTGRLVGLAVVGLLYGIWWLYGTRDAIRYLLPQTGPTRPPLWPSQGSLGSVIYFAGLLGLAAMMFYLSVSTTGTRATSVSLPWLLLLPPIGHSVILLGRAGVVVISLASTAILTFNLVHAYGYPVPEGLTLFLLAVLFTLVFTQIAVNAERSSGEVERLASALVEANQKLREYAVQVEELSAARERNRLAREIHDSVGHYLTVINVQLKAAAAMLAHDAGRAREAIDNAQLLTQDGLQDIRRSVAALRSSPLDGRTLDAALQQVVEESRAAGLETVLDVLGATRPLAAPIELTLYRAGQEGLTNARKHAQAKQARLVLDFRSESAVSLDVTDDGRGAEQATGGFGLLGLKERAQLLGGEVRVTTAPGSGFRLEVVIPG